MKVLVTGNLGYVGAAVVPHLRRTLPDATLVGYDNGWFGHCVTTQGALPETDLDQQVFGDVRDIDQAFLAGFDGVVQLAAVSNDPIGGRFEDATIAINQQATLRLARLSAAAGVKSFVFASSCSVYGFAADGAPRAEGDELNPLTAYARSKIGSERELEALSEDGMTITALRFATACGMSDRLRLDLVLNDFVAAAVSSGAIEVLSDGSPWRPLIHINDMARAIEWALTERVDVAKPFLSLNVGSDSWNYQVKDLAKAVQAHIPGTSVSINTDAPPDKRSYRVSFALYRQLAPNHQPKETLESAVKGLRDGLEAIKFNDPDFRKGALIRLKTLEAHMQNGKLTSDLRWVKSGEAA